jgi:hypothetical protein
MNVHNAKSTDLFIGYVTRTKSHWRVLFSVDEGIVTFLRMSDHDTMDQILKDEVKN